jgi:hypothetical protein
MNHKGLEQMVRERLWHSLSPGVAASMGWSMSELVEAAIGRKGLTPEEVLGLARRFGIQERT